MNIKFLSKYISIVFIFCLFIAGCKKDEGVGGTSTIRGKIKVIKFDSGFIIAEDTIPLVDEKAYIIYGNDKTTYDDDYNTSYDGSYEFNNLQKGKYKLFAYSKDSTGAYLGIPSEEKKAVLIEVEISSNGSTVDAPDIYVLDN